MSDLHWTQGTLDIPGAEPKEFVKRTKGELKAAVKCSQCGQWVREYPEQGTSVDQECHAAMVKLEQDPSFYGCFFIADGLAHRITQDERHINLRYWMEHRCPGFKS